jgi:hypothetical protein
MWPLVFSIIMVAREPAHASTPPHTPHRRDRPGDLCISAICGINPGGTHWTLTREQAVSQIEDRVSSFYIEKPGGKRFDVIVAPDPRADKYLKTIPDRDYSNELLFLPSCLHFAHK